MDIKPKLSGQWHDLFSDVDKLSEYANKIEINDSKIENYNLDRAQISNAIFTDTAWTNVNCQKGKLTNIVFKNSLFTGCDFRESTFLNAEFVNCKIDKSTYLKIEFSWSEIYKLQNN